MDQPDGDQCARRGRRGGSPSVPVPRIAETHTFAGPSTTASSTKADRGQGGRTPADHRRPSHRRTSASLSKSQTSREDVPDTAFGYRGPAGRRMRRQARPSQRARLPLPTSPVPPTAQTSPSAVAATLSTTAPIGVSVPTPVPRDGPGPGAGCRRGAGGGRGVHGAVARAPGHRHAQHRDSGQPSDHHDHPRPCSHRRCVTGPRSGRTHRSLGRTDRNQHANPPP